MKMDDFIITRQRFKLYKNSLLITLEFWGSQCMTFTPHIGRFSRGKTRCKVRERHALLRFKQQLTDEKDALSSWRGEECCKWWGVVCSNTTGHVTGLDLDASDGSFKLGGNISPALLELHHLNYLDLSWNDFGGAQIPHFIGSIKMLEYLGLRRSNISGKIPPLIGNLTKLRTLDLNYNFDLWSDNLYWLSSLSLLTELYMSDSYISDTNWLKHVVLDLPSLQILDLSGCELTDVITPSADLFVNSSSSSLTHLHLNSNKLTSSTFDWLFNISISLVSIDLSSNQLDGPIPDAFAKLKFLDQVILYENMLGGGLPKSLGNLSHLRNLFLSRNEIGGALEQSFGNLSSLEYLLLSQNQFTGPVPDLGACSELRVLNLRSNRLTGSLPARLLQLSKLEELSVSDNSLEGTITEANLMELHNLKILDLSFNSLTLDLSPDWIPPFQLDEIDLAACKISGSSFPMWLQTQKDLSYLDISLAGISDEVPKWLWNMSNVGYLNLSHNQISGTIPDFPSSSSLGILDVGSNDLSGPLPLLLPGIRVFQLSFNMFSGSISSICIYAVCQLQWLDVSNNRLEGELPSDWANMKDLEILNVNYNHLSGEIPHAMGSLSNLKTLHLRGNNFSGELPSTLQNCRLLQQLDIGENGFTGYIPPWLGDNLTSLAFLSSPRNMFYGDIPPEICRLTQIQLLDLSDNNLTGRIPKCFDNFTALVDKNRTITTRILILRVATNGYMDYALVQWKGQRAEYNRILGLLKLIDLSSNKLVGSIPESFSNLKGLISLNLSGNGLTGNINPGIGEMEMLETLDLSSNHLSGEIPVGLAQLTYLAVLDLANNNLSGQIPQSTQLQGFNESAYAGNYGLCGRPLPLCFNTSITTDQEDEDEDDDDINDKGDGWFTSTREFCISLALGFIVGVWGFVGSLVLKRSWRYAFFNMFDAVGNWLYVTSTLFVHKFRRC